eukprot:TRINITY_DN2545_c0_g1_i5.p1 TRINITY_DN2545_c0_g1~~TRINITY_DN2545_c0_g1_i5.p1  ORF type:complete len:328 (-),score=78.07 TRINITY_DN2545_c0_g1_i5:858-1841(-)
MSSSSSTTFDPTEFDLTSTIGEFLDRHMMFPLLAFLETTEMYPAEELQAAKVSLLKDTAMLGLYSQSYEQLHGSLEGAEDVEARLTDLKTQLNNLKATAKPLLKIIDDQELMIQFENQKTFNAEYLEENYDITETEINAMYHLAKLQYDAGKYQKAAPLLHNFTHLGKDTELIFNALWGKFACEIMTQNWDAAKNDLSALRDAIESKNWETPLEQLQQRTWLIHWSLFVFFNHPTGRNGTFLHFSFLSPPLPHTHLSNRNHRNVYGRQVHECHPDTGTTCPAIPCCRRHHQQTRPRCPQRPGQGYPGRKLHLQRPNHRIRPIPLCRL